VCGFRFIVPVCDEEVARRPDRERARVADAIAYLPNELHVPRSIRWSINAHRVVRLHAGIEMSRAIEDQISNNVHAATDNVHVMRAARSIDLDVSAARGCIEIAQVIGHKCGVGSYASQPFPKFQGVRVIRKELCVAYLSVRLAKVAVQIERNGGLIQSQGVHFGYVQRRRAAQRIHRQL
jgi:hypothetical protein